jgi:hypothetical protein
VTNVVAQSEENEAGSFAMPTPFPWAQNHPKDIDMDLSLGIPITLLGP